jgi:hypothetical protein
MADFYGLPCHEISRHPSGSHMQDIAVVRRSGLFFKFSACLKKFVHFNFPVNHSPMFPTSKVQTFCDKEFFS